MEVWKSWPRVYRAVTVAGSIFLVLVTGWYFSLEAARSGKKWWSKTGSAPAGGVTAEEREWKKLEIPQREAPFFVLKPTRENKYGVLPNQEFVLTAKEPVTKEFVNQNLETSPPFSIKEISATEFRLTPVSLLGLDQNITVALKVQGKEEWGHGFDRDYSWVFQTQSQFGVKANLPADKKTSVPVNAVIEIIFTQDDYQDPTPFLTIEPIIQFRSERHGENWAIVPLQPLDFKTVYTVKLRKGLDLQSRSNPIKEDLVFSFQTEEERKEGGRLSLKDDLIQLTPGDVPEIKVFTSLWQDETVAAKIYQFPSAERWLKSRQERDQRSGGWWTYFAEDNPVNTSGLALVGRADLKVQNREEIQYLALPTPLEAGYYLVQMSYQAGRKLEQLWIQSTNLSGYITVARNQTLVWVNDLATGQAVNGARVQIVGASGNSYTNDQGIAVFDTPRILFARQQPGRHYAQVTTAGQDLYLPIDSLAGNLSANQKTASDFWSYIYHERNLYKPSDTVYFWGVAKERDTALAPGKLEVSLSRGWGEDRHDTVNTQVVPGPSGIFSGRLDYQDLPAGWYYLTVRTGEVEIASRGLQIAQYTKPELKIEVETRPRAVFAGERVKFEVLTRFFDNTPAKNMTLQIHEEQTGVQKEMETNKKGSLAYSYETKYDIGADYPRYESVTVNPARAQTAKVEGHGSVYVFGPKVMLTSQNSQEGSRARFEAIVNHIDLSRINSGQSLEYRGKLVEGQEVKVQVVKRWWERIEKGTYYDFVEKVTRPAYDYQSREEKWPEVRLVTNGQGLVTHEFDMEKSQSYEVIATTLDENQRPVVAHEFYYFYAEGSNEGASSQPTIKLNKKENYFSLGEKVEVSIQQKGQLYHQAGSRFLFLAAHRGWMDFYARQEPELEFDFGPKYNPNAYIGAVIFTGRRYSLVAAGCEWSWGCYWDWGGHYFAGIEIRYQTDDSRIEITVNPDKDKYAPGQEALIVATAVKDGLPVVDAQLNLAVVDEALAAIGGVVTPSVLSSLYAPLPAQVYYQYHSHKSLLPDAPAAEKGGGGGNIRQLFKDTAYFDQAATDQAGRAEFRFKLPDNITSWLVYAQAVTNRLEAGQGETKMIVSKDFFVSSQFPLEVLTLDKPAVSASSFGVAVDANQLVRYTLAFGQGQREIKTEGKAGRAGEETIFSFPHLTPGEYQIGLTGRFQNLSDGVLLPLKVIDSRVNVEHGQTWEIAPGQKVEGKDIGQYKADQPIKLVVTDAGKGQYFWSLAKYCYQTSNRLEKQIAAIKASQLLNSRFGEKGCRLPETEKKLWQADDGGLAQVKWGGSDLETTVWALWVDASGWDKAKLVSYLKTKDGVYAAWGEAILGQPRIAVLQNLGRSSTEFEQKVLAGLALAALKDVEAAREIYYDLLADYAYENQPYIRIQRNKDSLSDQNMMVKDTAWMGLLASLVEGPYSQQLGAYLNHFRGDASDLVLDLAEIEFITRRLDKLPTEDTKVRFSTSSRGEKEIDVRRCQCSSLTLSPDEARGMKIETVSGRAQVEARYWLGRQALEKAQTDERLALRRTIKKAIGQGKIEPGDIVEVKLDFDVAESAPRGGYEISDLLPSGLVYLNNPEDYGLNPKNWVIYKGNSVKHYFYNYPGWRRDREPTVVYYARAAGAGEYLAEPAVFQSQFAPSVLQKTSEERIKIGN